MKRILLECGGKSPQLVLADAADLDSVAENVVAGAFWNMGENCSCGSRLIVHRASRTSSSRRSRASPASGPSAIRSIRRPVSAP